jgi:RNA-splicing ligase RtcB
MIKYFCNKNEIEQNAMDSIKHIENDVESICVFPDIHYCSERSIPIGVSFKSKAVFYPLVTGKDIGCGVTFLRFNSKEWKKPFNKFQHYNALNKMSQSFTDEGLGGGNHFLSIEEGLDGNTYIICHTGTRNLGIYMYQHFISLIDKYNYENNLNVEYLPIEMYDEELHIKYQNILDIGISRRKTFVEKTLNFLCNNGYVDSKCEYDIVDSIHNVFRIDKQNNVAYHHKGATELNAYTSFGSNEVVIPISMTRGSLIVKPKSGAYLDENLWSCAHGAGRKLSRTDSLKYWHSLKSRDKKLYEQQFSELLDRNGKFANGYLQEFDFAYKNSDTILSDQPFLKEVTITKPIVTIKFTEI